MFLDPDGYMPHGKIVAICACYIVAVCTYVYVQVVCQLRRTLDCVVFLNKSKVLSWVRLRLIRLMI